MDNANYLYRNSSITEQSTQLNDNSLSLSAETASSENLPENT